MNASASRIFVDANVLLYARDDRFPAKQEVATSWITALVERELIVISPQVIGEFCNVVLRKRLAPEAELRGTMSLLEPWCFGQVDVTLLAEALELRARTRFQWWDCVILASALRSGSRYLLTEDMSHGQVVDTVTVVDPFKLSPADILPTH